jgi:hypothetical protein
VPDKGWFTILRLFGTAFVERGGKVVEGFENLVTRTGETISGAVSGVDRMFERAGKSLFGSKRSQAEEGRRKDLVGYAKTKPKYAKQFGERRGT